MSHPVGICVLEAVLWCLGASQETLDMGYVGLDENQAPNYIFFTGQFLPWHPFV